MASDDLRARIDAAIRPNMLFGLQDAELDGPGGAERINEWADWISRRVAELVQPDLDRERELSQSLFEQRKQMAAERYTWQERGDRYRLAWRSARLRADCRTTEAQLEAERHTTSRVWDEYHLMKARAEKAEAALARLAPELDTEHQDRCPRCWCGDCGGRLDEHTEIGCGCESCQLSPNLACSLREFLPDAGIGYIAQQLGPLLSVHLGPAQQQRCLAVAHAAHHALHDYDQRMEG